MGKEEYIEQCKGDIVQDIIKIRLHIRKNCNGLCETAAATVHYHNRACVALQFGRDRDGKQRNIKNNAEEDIQRKQKKKKKEERMFKEKKAVQLPIGLLVQLCPGQWMFCRCQLNWSAHTRFLLGRQNK